MAKRARVVEPRQSTQPTRSEVARQQILAAAFRVVADHTINGTRMPMIAKEAGLSQGILHYYYDTKDNLLLNLCNWLLDALREYRGIATGQIVSCADPDDPAKLCQTFLRYLRLLIEDERDMVRVFYDFWVQAAAETGAVRNSLRRQFRLYRNDVKQIFQKSVRIRGRDDILAAMVVSLFEGAALQLILDEKGFDLNEYLTLTERLMTDLLADTSRKR
ncbi:MAG: hypothetical protein QOK29_4778 [Rhodospirillaceae bacterium]|nr:hypothetical protein [Rhodospirillaceae bacterium]